MEPVSQNFGSAKGIENKQAPLHYQPYSCYEDECPVCGRCLLCFSCTFEECDSLTYREETT